MSQQDDERIARKLLDLGSRSDRVQIRNGMTYLDGYALGNGTVEIRSQVARDRRRRLWIQGAVPDYPVKILFDRGDSFGRLRYWVGGWGSEPTDFTQIDTGAAWVQLYGITATGPGPNDWIVGGRVNDMATTTVHFYDYQGLVREYVSSTLFAGGVVATGHLACGTFGNVTLGVKYYWATLAANAIVSATTPPFYDRFVLPSVLSGNRLEAPGWVAATMRNVVVPNPDLTYSVFSGQYPFSPNPIGNPWIASSGGTFTRLSTNLNSVIGRSDLIGTTLYARNVFLTGRGPWANPLIVTPHSINPTTGVVTSQSPKEVSYLLPSGRGGSSIIDSSIWFD